jgi:hypothetical protein
VALHNNFANCPLRLYFMAKFVIPLSEKLVWHRFAQSARPDSLSFTIVPVCLHHSPFMNHLPGGGKEAGIGAIAGTGAGALYDRHQKTQGKLAESTNVYLLVLK